MSHAVLRSRPVRFLTAYLHPGALACLGLVLLGILLDWLALPPGPIPYAIFIADVPFLLLIRQGRGQRYKRWAFLYGALHYGISTRWLAGIHPGQVVAVMVILGPIYVLMGTVLRRLLHWRAPFVLTFGLCAVAEEMVRTVWMGGMPWPARSLSFVTDSALEGLVPAASLVGAYGLSFLAATCGACLCQILWPLRTGDVPSGAPARRWVGPVIVPVLAAVVLGGAASARRSAYESALEAGEVAETERNLVVIQGNIPQALKHAPRAQESIFARHMAVTKDAFERLPAGSAFGVLWPETMLPWPLVDAGLAARFPTQWDSYVNVVRRMAVEVPAARDLTWLVGAIYLFERPGEPHHGDLFLHGTSDSMFQLEPAQAPRPGEPNPRPDPTNPAWTPPWERARHDKNVLVPGGEYTPLGELFPILRFTRNFVSVIPELDRGAWDQTPMTLKTGPGPGDVIKAGTIICFEVAFPARCRAWRRFGADLLVNSANYGWFGQTGFRAQIRALARLRAAELAVTVVMAGNTGPTAFCDPLGRSYGTFHPARFANPDVTPGPAGADWTTHQPGWVSAPVFRDPATTLYVALGDGVWWAAMGLLVLVVWILHRRGLGAIRGQGPIWGRRIATSREEGIG